MDAGAPDFDRELKRLLRGLALSETFHLYIAWCDDATLADRVVEAIDARLPAARKRPVKARRNAISFSGTQRSDVDRQQLVERTLGALTAPPPEDALRALVHVLDATRALRAEEDDWRLVFQRLNEARNVIAKSLKGELVVLLPPWMSDSFAKAAPDVRSIAAGAELVFALPEVRQDPVAASRTPPAEIPDDPVALRKATHDALGVAQHLLDGDAERAVQAVERAHELARAWVQRLPKDRDALVTLADVLALASEQAERAGARTRALDLAQDAELYTRGVGDTGEARAALSRRAERVGDLLDLSGRRTDAIEAYERAWSDAAPLDAHTRFELGLRLLARYDRLGESSRSGRIAHLLTPIAQALGTEEKARLSAQQASRSGAASRPPEATVERASPPASPPAAPPRSRGWTRDELGAARDVFARLYPSEEDARRVVADLHLDGARIVFSGNARMRWHEIIEGLDRYGAVGDAVALAIREHPDDEPLRRLLEREARPAAPAFIPPPGGSYARGVYVSRPALERAARGYLANPGTPLAILGPPSTGKTWLTEHLLDEVRAVLGARIARVDLREVPHEDQGNFAVFSDALLRVLSRALDVAETGEHLAADTRLTPVLRITELVEAALDKASGNVCLVLDIPDDLPAWTGWRDIEGMLRSWNDRAREVPWHRLRIVLLMSTSAAPASRAEHGSPFRVSPVRVGDFSSEEVDALAQRYGVALTPEDHARVQGVVGGHPLLLAAVFHGVSAEGLDLARACDPKVNTTLGHALQRCAPRLDAHAELPGLLRLIARSPGAALTPAQQRDVGPLESAGLVRRGGSGWVLRLPIFAELDALR